MTDQVRSSLFDIQKAIKEIESFLPIKRDFFEFKNDIKTKRAVERNIEIVGEAMYRILQEEASIQITDARKIVDTRNRIIHGYDKVSDEIIWGIVNRNLPILKVEIEALVAQE